MSFNVFLIRVWFAYENKILLINHFVHIIIIKKQNMNETQHQHYKRVFDWPKQFKHLFMIFHDKADYCEIVNDFFDFVGKF